MMRRVRMVVQALLAGGVAVAMLPGNAHADDGALKVYGYITNAVATPVAFQYNQPSFGVPATPTFEVRYFHSESHTDSGPSGRSLSSVVWPGDLAGNAPPSLVLDTFLPRDLITQTTAEDDGWTQFRQGLIDGSAGSPSYPVRAESFYPQSPHASRNDVAAGLSMSSSQVDREGNAVTAGSNAGFPGLFTASHMNSSTFSGIRNGVAVSDAFAAAKDMTLLGGLIHVQGFQTHKTVTSDGTHASIDGSLQLSGLTIAGVRVLSVDQSGTSIGGSAVPWDQALQTIHDQLAPQGITVKLAEADEKRDGADGHSHVFGVSITLDSRAMKKFADSLPEPLRGYVESPGSSPAGPGYDQLPGTAQGFSDSIVQFDQSLTVLLGDVSVGSTASPQFDISIPMPPVQPLPIPPAPPSITTVTPPIVPPLPTTPVQPAFAPATRPVAASTGVPLALAFATFVLAAGATAGLRWFADCSTAATGPGTTRCSLSQ